MGWDGMLETMDIDEYMVDLHECKEIRLNPACL